MEARLTLLYGSVIAVQNELAELQQSIGAGSYQIGEELEARSSFPPCFIIHYISPTGKHQEVFATYPPESIHLPLQGQSSQGICGSK